MEKYIFVGTLWSRRQATGRWIGWQLWSGKVVLVQESARHGSAGNHDLGIPDGGQFLGNGNDRVYRGHSGRARALGKPARCDCGAHRGGKDLRGVRI